MNTTIAAQAAPASTAWNFTRWSPRTASLVAGIALAVTAVVAGVANFAAITPLVVPGDATATADAISGNQTQFLAGIIGLYFVIVLDIVVAVAWFTLFAPVSRTLSAIAAWARVVFALGFTIAISQLVVALKITEDPPATLAAATAFTTIWVSVLGIFGVHLLLIGYLAFRSGFVARIFGVLLVIAGSGYIADAIGMLTIPGFTAIFAGFLFVGELAIIFWLLIRGARLPRAAAAAS
ncbi:MAG: DUF4386 domain-containing protein [Microbacteriaceae bacterium]|nr:DUF4386 domain-containing protein [Microbacteriaceae bacterium]